MDEDFEFNMNLNEFDTIYARLQRREKRTSPYQDAVQIIENISGNKTSFLTAQ